jgi:hypothetical protein
MQKGAKKMSSDHAKPKHQKNRKNTTASSLSDMASFAGDGTPEPEFYIGGDYSKAKAPPNQIPIAQFWGFCEPAFFRPLNDEDFKFLNDSVCFSFFFPPIHFEETYFILTVSVISPSGRYHNPLYYTPTRPTLPRPMGRRRHGHVPHV